MRTKILLLAIAVLLLMAASPGRVRYRSEWTTIPAQSSATFEHRLGVLPADLDVWCARHTRETTVPCYETGEVHIWNVTTGVIVIENWASYPVRVLVAAAP